MDFVRAAIPPRKSSAENEITTLRKFRRGFSFGGDDFFSGSILSPFVL